MKQIRFYKMQVKDYASICSNNYWEQFHNQNKTNNKKYLYNKGGN